jgi:hypothetical protein
VERVPFSTFLSQRFSLRERGGGCKKNKKLFEVDIKRITD